MRRVLAAMLLGAVLCAAPGAEAKDLNGRFGIGGARTLGGVQGLDVIYWMGTLGINGTINLIFGSPEDGDSIYGLRVAAGLLLPIINGESAQLSVGGRVNIGKVKGVDAQLALEAPLRLQWYVTNHLSLFAEVGVVFESVPDDGRVLGSAGGSTASDGIGVAIGATYLTAGGGFTVLF